MLTAVWFSEEIYHILEGNSESTCLPNERIFFILKQVILPFMEIYPFFSFCGADLLAWMLQLNLRYIFSRDRTILEPPHLAGLMGKAATRKMY